MKKMKTKSQKGITLVELMVAITTGIIVILATGIVVFLGQTSWNDAWRKVNLQRDASLAMLTMSQRIKKATSATVDPNGDLNLVDPCDGNIKFSYDAGNDDLNCQIGGTSHTVINGTVTSLQFTLDDVNDTVKIEIELEQDNAQTYLESTIMMRNTGG